MPFHANRALHRSSRSIPSSRGGAGARADVAVDLRCDCHKLLARAVPEGLELRCPRCKVDHLLTWARLRELEASHGDTPSAPIVLHARR